MTNAEYQKHRLTTGPCLLVSLSEILTRYTEEQGTEMDSAIRDALTDLRHLCDVHALGFGEIDANAYEGYIEELEYAAEPL